MDPAPCQCTASQGTPGEKPDRPWTALPATACYQTVLTLISALVFCCCQSVAALFLLFVFGFKSVSMCRLEFSTVRQMMVFPFGQNSRKKDLLRHFTPWCKQPEWTISLPQKENPGFYLRRPVSHFDQCLCLIATVTLLVMKKRESCKTCGFINCCWLPCNSLDLSKEKGKPDLIREFILTWISIASRKEWHLSKWEHKNIRIFDRSSKPTKTRLKRNPDQLGHLRTIFSLSFKFAVFGVGSWLRSRCTAWTCGTEEKQTRIHTKVWLPCGHIPPDSHNLRQIPRFLEQTHGCLQIRRPEIIIASRSTSLPQGLWLEWFIYLFAFLPALVPLLSGTNNSAGHLAVTVNVSLTAFPLESWDKIRDETRLCAKDTGGKF